MNLHDELQQKLRRQAQEIRDMQEVAERRNRELDALHLVWCDGGCGGGIHRYVDGTRDPAEVWALADIGQRNVDRLRSWAKNRNFNGSPAQKEWGERINAQIAERAATGTAQDFSDWHKTNAELLDELQALRSQVKSLVDGWFRRESADAAATYLANKATEAPQ